MTSKKKIILSISSAIIILLAVIISYNIHKRTNLSSKNLAAAKISEASSAKNTDKAADKLTPNADSNASHVSVTSAATQVPAITAAATPISTSSFAPTPTSSLSTTSSTQSTPSTTTTPAASTPPAAIATPTTSSQVKTITLTGFIQDEDCFVQYVNPDTGASSEDPGDDSKSCLQMYACADSGFGITVKQSDGTCKFYYFDGNFSTGKKGTFSLGTGGQLLAWQLIQKTSKENHITITVTGTLNGDTRTNTNATFPGNQDGRYYPVVTVSQVSEN
ncbi:MAG: hypothetical protein Q8900_12950 [Bacillota bacterium]|nr:hypothetical protein [Bacillota bacterium]